MRHGRHFALRRLAGAVLTLAAATSWAAPVATPSGKALRAEYTIKDQRGARTLLVIRSNDRIEYRDGSMIRIWRKLDDGIEQIDAFPDRQRSVVYSPGDLESVHRTPQWNTLASLLSDDQRSGLEPHGKGKRFAGTATERFIGKDRQQRAVALEWMAADQLPVSYTIAGVESVQLKSLQTMDAATAFTPLADYRSHDFADLGDETLDPFAARYLEMTGGHRHPH